MRDEVREIQRRLGLTTVFVTHDQEEALAISDRIAVLSDGRIEDVGTPFQVYRHPRTTFVARFVGDVNVIPVETGDAALYLRPETMRLVRGSTASAHALSGTIESVTFHGARRRYAVHCEKLATPLVVEVSAHDDVELGRGASVVVDWDPANATKLPLE